MKLREVFRYELEHLLRSPSTWIYAAILFGIAFLTIHAQTEDIGPVHVNSPDSLAVYAVSIGMFGILITAALFADASVRDIQASMDPLLFTSPLRKVEYLGGRFLAALVINAVVVLAIPLGLATATLMPYLDPASFGPLRPLALLQPWLFFLLPNLVLTGAILFMVGVLARQVIPVYLAAVGVVLSFLVAVQSLSELDIPVLAVLGDPMGMLTLMPMVEYSTAAERNTRLVGLPATLLWNRLVWLAVAAAVLAVLHRRFRFAHDDGGGRQRKERRVIVEAESGRARPVEVPRVSGADRSGRAASGRLRSGAESQSRRAGSFGFRTTVRQTLAVARNSLAELVASRWFIVVLLACVGLTMLWGWNVGDTVFDTSTWPVTLLVAETALSERIAPLIFMLIAVYAGELVWQEREVGVEEIADAAPVPDGIALLGRFLALVAMLVMFQVASMVGGILIQALQGYYNFEPGLYLRVVFGLNLADYVLLAALAMTIHVLVNQKYLGHMIALLAIVFTWVAEQFGIRHHLLAYGTTPGWTYSDMNGFGPFIGPFVWFKLYWAAWALLLAVVATVLWVRGRESGMRRRLRQARARFTGPVMRTAGVATLLILVLGGFIFYNTNVLNEYRTSDEIGAPYAAYEKRYARYENVPQPTMGGVQLHVEIYPEEHAVELRGSYSLVNRSREAIDSVHV
ncbi:MAG: ABC transporter permease, partial [Longimicrobiales bacterium]